MKNELEDKELLDLVGQPATRENIKKLKHGGSTGADGTIKSVVTRTEMEQQQNLCPRYYRKKYAVVGGFTAILFFSVLSIIGIFIHGQTNIPFLFINNGLGAFVAAIWVIFILDIKRQKDIRGIR